MTHAAPVRAGDKANACAAACGSAVGFIAFALKIFQQAANLGNCRRLYLKRFLADTIARDRSPGHQINEDVIEQTNRVARVHLFAAINNVLVHYSRVSLTGAKC